MILRRKLRALQLAVTECHAIINNMYYRMSEIEVVIKDDFEGSVGKITGID